LVPKRLTVSLVVAAALALPACASLTLHNVNYGWPVESVLMVTPANTVEEVRYALSFPVGSLAAAEFQDSTALRGASLRIIRNAEGYYFITGPRFKHVFVFAPRAGALAEYTVLEVSTTGLTAPAFNLRPPYVELIDAGSSPRLLTSSDLVEGKK
jgi:hypothetical protein